MHQLLQLLIPFSHKKELQGKSILFGILVEFGKKWVFRKSLKYQPRIEMAGKQMGKRGFSCPDISLHRNKMIVHEAVNIRIPFVLSPGRSYFFYGQGIRTFPQKFLHRFPGYRMNEAGRNFIQRLQHKPAFRNPGMRNDKRCG